MVIYEFDTTDNLNTIENTLVQIDEIKNGLSIHRDKFRELSETIKINKNSLYKCCDTFESSFVIQCYTFSEQLTKNTIYELLAKDKNKNDYINTFINKKIPTKKFSPNIKIKEIQDNINSVCNDFKFFVSLSQHEIGVYNEMIESRHRYSHLGNYEFQFDNYADVIKCLKYLEFELCFLIQNPKKRYACQNELEYLKKIAPKIIVTSKAQNNYKHTKSLLLEIRKKSNFINKNFSVELAKPELLKTLNERLNELLKIDLRSLDKSIAVVEKFCKYYNIPITQHKL